MFFTLSKLISFLTTPLTWIGIFLLLAFFSRDKIKKKRRLMWTTFLFIMFTNLFLAQQVMHYWEPKPVNKRALHKKYDVGIVLSGGMALPSLSHQITFKHNIDRILQAILLYKEGYIKHILISGGNGTLKKDNDMNEALLLKNFLLQLGIPKEHIWIDSLSRNTWENATYSVGIIKKFYPQSANVLLITSASHMVRSFACFVKAGLVPDMFPVDTHTNTSEYDLVDYLLPNTDALMIWNELFHEWIGILAYYIMGYI